MQLIDSLLQTSFVIFGILVIVLILIRRGEGGGGLGGALGGGMGADSVLGVKAAKTLDKLIAWISGIFLFIGLLMYTPLIREGGLATINQSPLIDQVTVDKTTVKVGEDLKISVDGLKDPEGHEVSVRFYVDDGDGNFVPTFDEQKNDWLRKPADISADGKTSVSGSLDKAGKYVIWVRAEDNQAVGKGYSMVKRVDVTVTKGDGSSSSSSSGVGPANK